jgi:hypothetical protein
MASLEPGIRVGFAQHFQAARPLGERLQLNTGVVTDAGRFWPRTDWRFPSADELALLTAGEAEPGALRLFAIPERLRTGWWEFAAAQTDGASESALTFNQVAGEISEFLGFKRLPLPRPSALEVIVSAPELPSIKPEMAGLAAPSPWPGLRSGINLGDQETSLVFINLDEEQLRERQLDCSRTAPFLELVAAFLTAHPEYPVMQIRLQPCEGYWLPPTSLAFDFDTRGRGEVDVQLLIRAVIS